MDEDNNRHPTPWEALKNQRWRFWLIMGMMCMIWGLAWLSP